MSLLFLRSNCEYTSEKLLRSASKWSIHSNNCRKTVTAFKKHWQPEPGVFVGNIKVSTGWQSLFVILRGDDTSGNLRALEVNDYKGSLEDHFLCLSFPRVSWRLNTGFLYVFDQNFLEVWMNNNVVILCFNPLAEFYYLENRNTACFTNSGWIWNSLFFSPSPPFIKASLPVVRFIVHLN